MIPADLSDSAKELRRISLLTVDEDRKALLNSSTRMDNPDFYRKMRPEAYCEKKVRIGEKGDGGKFVCNPTKVKNDCTLLSLGLNNQIGYDKHIFEATGGVCQIFGADKIFIEIHGLPVAHLKMLKVMSKYGFRIFNVDPNPYCVNCCEYSLINELCMSQYEVVPLGVIIPQ